jgi:putative heme transporter
MSTPPPNVPAETPEQEELAVDEASASRNLRHGLITLGILVALVVGLLLAVPGLHGVAREVTHMAAALVVLAIMCEILSCASYVVAFLQVFERAPVRFGARVALSELAFGAAVSLGGAGSVAIGALLIVERGGDPGRVAERSAVLFLLTSAINVITLALAGLGLWVGILPGKSDVLLSLVPGLVGVFAFVGFLVLPWVADRLLEESHQGRIATVVRTTSEAIRDTARYLFTPDWRTLGAFGYLWFDITVLVVCFWAIGPVPPLSAIVLAYQIGYISNLIPIPGSIGVLDGSFVGLFVLYGVSATTATAATVVYHAISLWVPAMWGTIAFLLLRRSRGEPLMLRPTRAERRAAKASAKAAKREAGS